uniref:Uncharacterized protein n=1 Tax=Arundo donax TaxID=35708 RepID=A0A0A8XP15_ARUDO
MECLVAYKSQHPSYMDLAVAEIVTNTANHRIEAL